MESLYNDEGVELETVTELEISELPAAVVNYINENYAGFEIEEAESVDANGSTTFEVEIEGSNDQELELIFDADGNFLQIVNT